jgi:uncharacterized repeat protein (TIGR04138 family)
MSLRDDLAGVLARDPRYTIQAYAFPVRIPRIHQEPEETVQARGRGRGKTPARTRHVSGRELCEGFRNLALNYYGLLALTVLGQWGIRSTSDIGEMVYNLIASGDLEKTPKDARPTSTTCTTSRPPSVGIMSWPWTMSLEVEGDRPMDARRLRLTAALILFLAWVGVLGTMAILSGRRPALRPRAAAPPGHSSGLAPGVLLTDDQLVVSRPSR